MRTFLLDHLPREIEHLAKLDGEIRITARVMVSVPDGVMGEIVAKLLGETLEAPSKEKPLPKPVEAEPIGGEQPERKRRGRPKTANAAAAEPEPEKDVEPPFDLAQRED